MSTDPAYARPSQVTVAGWAIAACSVVVLLIVFQTMGELNSIGTREEVRRFLDDGATRGLGLSVDDALGILRWALLVAGVAAVVTGVLGVYVLQRNHAARLVLSVAAFPIVVISPFAGQLFGMVIGAGALMLWSRPARDWFAGRPITRPEPVRREPPAAPAPPPAPDLRMPDAPSATPPPTASWGSAPASHVDFPPPTTAPVWPAVLPPFPSGATLADRPRKVRIACILTWVFGGLSALGATVLIVAIAVARDELVDRVVTDPRWDPSLDRDLVAPAVLVFSVFILIWCLVNMTLAYFVWRRSFGAWIALSISVGVAAVFAVLGFPQSLPHMIALAVSLGALMSPSSRAWFLRN